MGAARRLSVERRTASRGTPDDAGARDSDARNVTAPLDQAFGEVCLRDGSLIATRAAVSDDLEALARGIPELRGDPHRLARLTHPHEALVAVAPDREPIGLGRLARDHDGSHLAHAVVAVVEEWRGRGVATALLSRLAEIARGMGVQSFALACRAAPAEARSVLGGLGPVTVVAGADGLATIHVELPPRVGYATPLSHVLRNVAAGRLDAAGTLDVR
jgi:GNAT superfamily N-acetyltransferase